MTAELDQLRNRFNRASRNRQRGVGYMNYLNKLPREACGNDDQRHGWDDGNKAEALADTIQVVKGSNIPLPKGWPTSEDIARIMGTQYVPTMKADEDYTQRDEPGYAEVREFSL